MTVTESPEGTTKPIDSPSIRVGDVVFTRARVTLMRDGQLVTSVSRSAVNCVDIGDGPASEHSGREVVWGVLAIMTAILSGAANLTSSNVSIGALLMSSAFFFIGLILIRSASGTVTVVHLRGSAGDAQFPVGRPLKQEDIATIRQRLFDELGYPPPPAPQPRGY